MHVLSQISRLDSISVPNVFACRRLRKFSLRHLIAFITHDLPLNLPRTKRSHFFVLSHIDVGMVNGL